MQIMLTNYLIMAERNKNIVPYRELEKFNVFTGSSEDAYLKYLEIFVLNKQEL